MSKEPDRPARPLSEADADAVAWLPAGLATGALGALLVALVFLAVDVARGLPLWTPTALGSALFLGERLAPEVEAGWQPALVVGYTALHGTVFVAFGTIAAFLLLTRTPSPRRSRRVTALLGAAALFVCFEVTFLGFAAISQPELARDLGAGPVAAANALAALAMAGFLVYAPARRSADPGR
jgi:hypothetical protein